ncbi:unnamed protein product [Rotaria sordida]|uniref:Uncharacterized protein n=1 Tax=Rotaria sordida TaxID=392033 RepID=A0A813VC80_9BILA|nr:unnamed protein product [Rotaria sordida]CAF3559143.1 unnamed protein product [Rotaria sordida]
MRLLYDKTTTTMVNNNTNNVWRLLWTLIHEWFSATFIHLCIMHTILVFQNNNHSHNHNHNHNGRNNRQGKLKI